MDDDEGKVEISTDASKSSTENDTVAALNGQIDELKRELDAVKKKLHKAEFERDNAQKNAENLKREVKELSKKLQEERKKNAGSKRKKGNETFQGWYMYGRKKWGGGGGGGRGAVWGGLGPSAICVFLSEPQTVWPARLWGFKISSLLQCTTILLRYDFHEKDLLMSIILTTCSSRRKSEDSTHASDTY